MNAESDATQKVFETCYRGRQSALHHMAYMRMSKVLLALRAIEINRIDLRGKAIFDFGFGAGTFYRYCPKTAQLFGVEQDPATVGDVADSLRTKGYRSVDLQPISIDKWEEHPLLQRSYDLFLCSHVLEHLPDPASFLRTIRKCIAGGGAFLGLVPINERAKNPHHLHALSREMVAKWAEDSGLVVDWYEENDPFIDRIQPLYTVDTGFAQKLARIASIGLGIPATLLGYRAWFALGKAFAALTGSKATQAAFILRHGGLSGAIQSARATQTLVA